MVVVSGRGQSAGGVAARRGRVWSNGALPPGDVTVGAWPRIGAGAPAAPALPGVGRKCRRRGGRAPEAAVAVSGRLRGRAGGGRDHGSAHDDRPRGGRAPPRRLHARGRAGGAGGARAGRGRSVGEERAGGDLPGPAQSLLTAGRLCTSVCLPVVAGGRGRASRCCRTGPGSRGASPVCLRFRPSSPFSSLPAFSVRPRPAAVPEPGEAALPQAERAVPDEMHPGGRSHGFPVSTRRVAGDTGSSAVVMGKGSSGSG